MATKTAILSVKIVSDAADFSKKMDDSVSKLDKFQNAAKKLAVPAAAIVAGIGSIAVSAGKMASEAEQNFGAVDAVFKDHANSVKEMAKTSAKNLGLSGSDYAKYSALLGAQLKNGGTSMDQLADRTNKLIGYGADFAAQFGGTVPDAVEALSSALKGEMDPIEKYGISLNQAKIDAEASALGFEKVGGSWEESAKQAAIMSLIAKQGGDAMGAFAREADTAAGKQERANAAWKDAQAKLGEVLLPIMADFADKLAEAAKWLQENINWVGPLVAIIGALAGAIVLLNIGLAIMNILAAVNPFVLLIVGVTLLVGAIVWLATQTTFFQDVWAAVCLFVGDRINEIVGWLTGLGRDAQGVADGMRQWFVDAATNIANWFRDRVNEIVGFFTNLGTQAQNKANAVRDWFVNAFNGMRDTASNIVNGIVGFFDRIGSAVRNAMNWVRNLFNMGGMPGWLKSVLGMGGTGFALEGVFPSSAAFAAPVAGEFGIGATGGLSYGSIVSGGSTAAAPVVNNYNITVNGAVDSDSAARQIVGLLERYNRNTGRTPTAKAGL